MAVARLACLRLAEQLAGRGYLNKPRLGNGSAKRGGELASLSSVEHHKLKRSRVEISPETRATAEALLEQASAAAALLQQQRKESLHPGDTYWERSPDGRAKAPVTGPAAEGPFYRHNPKMFLGGTKAPKDGGGQYCRVDWAGPVVDGPTHLRKHTATVTVEVPGQKSVTPRTRRETLRSLTPCPAEAGPLHGH